ncbi:hypothetical protein DY000_02049039 [Brassica cretica]|uniref:Ribosomal protein S11 n=1 Tax=Brassica cretica TaxID=69181 RepID=A0ABQ7F6Y4_BRACR|nr:hypothetical protein DY000_02049039 [Brassica cretica]
MVGSSGYSHMKHGNVYIAEMSSDSFFSFWEMAERGMLPQLLYSCLWLKLQERICSIATGEQGPVPGDSESKSGLPNPNASPFKSFSEIKAGLSNTGGKSFNTFSEDMRSGLTLEFTKHSRKRFLCSELPKLHSVYRKTWTLLEEDEGRRASWLFSHFHRPNLETNADIIHIKLLRNNTFVTVTDSKGNVKIKCKATSGSLPDLKGGRKMMSYTADATAENIGRRVKAMGLKSVVVKARMGLRISRRREMPLLPSEAVTPVPGMIRIL